MEFEKKKIFELGVSNVLNIKEDEVFFRYQSIVGNLKNYVLTSHRDEVLSLMKTSEIFYILSY